MRRSLTVASLALAISNSPQLAEGGVASKVINEAIEFASRKFVKEAAEEGVQTLTSKITQLAAKHGDDLVASALKKVGPRVAKITADAGEHGGVALRLLAQHGDKAVGITLKKGSLATIERFGDNAATAILKHGSVGESVIGQFGREGVEALARVTPQNGRRIAMLAGDGVMKPELLEVIVKYGDEASNFIWRNKGALAVGSTLATFLAAPEEFLHGTQQLASIVADSAVKPLAAIPGTVLGEAARGINWNLVVFIVSIPLGFVMSRWLRLGESIRNWVKLRQEQINKGKESRHVG
ncbi:hypothetical protein K2X85_18365 [bacterium]|nr:hypothetical protein [bacterium]